jgi:hypothetical protein
MFCTYAHYTPQGRLFYIGKGANEYRAYYMKNRNKYWNSVVEKHGQPEVKILATWGTNKEACSHEVLLISCFRDMGYKLVNLTNGGEGTSGRKLTKEHKQKISKALKGRAGIKPSEATRKKLRLSHLGKETWNKGKKGVYKPTKETAEKISKALKGRTHKVIYKHIGTNLKTNEKIVLAGVKEIKDSGFNSTCIYRCAAGKRKSHKGYTWAKELLENQ